MTDPRAIAELGDRVAEDGPAAHNRQLDRLSALAAAVAPAAAAVLADPSASPVQRERALAAASAAILRRPCDEPTPAVTAA